jgi:hypothetical protein
MQNIADMLNILKEKYFECYVMNESYYYYHQTI